MAQRRSTRLVGVFGVFSDQLGQAEKRAEKMTNRFSERKRSATVKIVDASLNRISKKLPAAIVLSMIAQRVQTTSRDVALMFLSAMSILKIPKEIA